MARYTAVIDGEAGAYGVVIPDLPGCTAMGKTTDEALRNAVEAASAWADDAKASGETLPPPRPIEVLRNDSEVAEALAAGGVLATVPVILDLATPAKANVSIDKGLLMAIDEAAEARGITRSAFIADASRKEIAGSV